MELALVVPILVLLFLVSFDLGIASQETVIVSEVAHSALRSATFFEVSTSGQTNAENLVERVNLLLRGAGLDETAFTVWVRTSPSTMTQTGVQRSLLSLSLQRVRGQRLSGFLKLANACVKDVVLLPELVQFGDYTTDSEPGC